MAETLTAVVAARQQRSTHRSLTERLIVTGQLVLTRPAHFGNGDADALTDMPLLVDEVDGRPLITGASLAGALRNYLRELQWGYELPLPSRDPQSPYYRVWVETEADLLATSLFGGHRGDDEGAQSPLIVDDALSPAAGYAATELRDGVALDAKTRTALGDKKFDYQLLPAGTRFNLHFELLLDNQVAENIKRKRALAIALDALAKGEIYLGARKRRGFGQCRVDEWAVTSYKLHNSQHLLAWLAADHDDWEVANGPAARRHTEIAEILGVDLATEGLSDRRELFEVTARFAIDGSLLVRSGFGEQDRGPDVMHMHTHSESMHHTVPILPGTSIAGALRQRALRIVNTLTQGSAEAKCDPQQFVAAMFGPAEIKTGEDARASRLFVAENSIEGGRTLVQTRIKIDRFTGGTIEGALMEEAPHFGGEITLHLTLRNPDDGEIGLLLLLLKDLWLGDLPLGGEASIGRGRLRGLWAKLHRTGPALETLTLQAEEEDGTVTFSDTTASARLEAYVKALHRKVIGG